MSNLEFELKYKNCIVAGVDEAGRGSLAGPVVAGAVIVDRRYIIPGIKDSKQLSSNMRELLYKEIIAHYKWGVGTVDVEEIDKINILQATKGACLLAVANLKVPQDLVLIDGNMPFYDAQKFISIVNGDNLSLSIAAGSIIAKVTRDRLMLNLDKEFPNYWWKNNFGYGTKAHITAIKEYGRSIHHRKSFKIKL